jgi:hypothetical protein
VEGKILDHWDRHSHSTLFPDEVHGLDDIGGEIWFDSFSKTMHLPQICLHPPGHVCPVVPQAPPIQLDIERGDCQYA